MSRLKLATASRSLKFLLIHGANRVQAQPADRRRRKKSPGEFPGDRRNRPLQSMAVDFVCCCAAAGGSGHCPVVCCPAAAGGCRLSLPGKPENSGTLIYGSRIRRKNRRQQVGPGTARRRIRELESMVPEFVSEPAAASGSRPCRPAASGCRLSLPAASGSRHCRPGRQLRRENVFLGEERFPWRRFYGMMNKIHSLRNSACEKIFCKSKRVLSDIPYDRIGTEDEP